MSIWVVQQSTYVRDELLWGIGYFDNMYDCLVECDVLNEPARIAYDQWYKKMSKYPGKLMSFEQFRSIWFTPKEVKKFGNMANG